MKVKKALIKSLIIIVTIVVVAFLLAVAYYKRLHPYPHVAEYRDNYLVYKDAKYSFIGSVEPHELDIEFETLGCIKYKDWKTNWILNTPVLTFNENNRDILIIPAWQGTYSIYSLNPDFTIEEFKRMND